MAYNLKDIFYLETSMTTGTGNGDGTTQLDLSSYIDPIARKGSKAQGLAVYRVQTSITEGDSAVPGMDLDGSMKVALIAGAGFGDVAVGSTISFNAGALSNSNDLLVYGADYYQDTGVQYNNFREYCTPTKDVPYIIVRDNICLALDVDDAFATALTVAVRMECAVVTLDQATLNQLLRTQTV
tara:strand:- start:233 stop:781 length:549 start_codon:yes stop_codon:yes gene_type:complete